MVHYVYYEAKLFIELGLYVRQNVLSLPWWLETPLFERKSLATSIFSKSVQPELALSDTSDSLLYKNNL